MLKKYYLLAFLVLVNSTDAAGQTSVGNTKKYESCGKTTLYLLLKFSGKAVSWKDVEERLGEAGALNEHSFSAMIDAASSFGLDLVGSRSDRLSSPSQLATPAIVQLAIADNVVPHFVVLLSSEEDGVWILDPPGGPRFQSTAEFQQIWTGNALSVATGQRAADSLLEVWAFWLSTGAVLIGLVFRCYGFGGMKFAIPIASIMTIVAFTSKSVFPLPDGYSSTEIPPVLLLDKEYIDLGIVETGTVETEFRIKNLSAEDVKFTSVLSSCSCVKPLEENVVIPAKGSFAFPFAVEVGDRYQRVSINFQTKNESKTVAISWIPKHKPCFSPRRLEVSCVAGGPVKTVASNLSYLHAYDRSDGLAISSVTCPVDGVSATLSSRVSTTSEYDNGKRFDNRELTVRVDPQVLSHSQILKVEVIGTIAGTEFDLRLPVYVSVSPSLAPRPRQLFVAADDDQWSHVIEVGGLDESDVLVSHPEWLAYSRVDRNRIRLKRVGKANDWDEGEIRISQGAKNVTIPVQLISEFPRLDSTITESPSL